MPAFHMKQQIEGRKSTFVRNWQTKYSVLFGTKSNFLLPLGPLTVFPSDLSFKASFEHSHWNNVTSSLAALAMSKAHCITCWVLNGRSSSGSRSPMFVSWHSSCSRAALDVKEFNAWRTVLILEFYEKKEPTIYFIWAEQVQKYGYYTQNKIYNTHISAQQNIASIYKI